MPKLIAIVILSLLGISICAFAEDWPMERRDVRRSGVTEENLDAARLKELWQWTSSQPPAPAWPSPARWDAYASLAGMKSMRNYDPVQHPIVVGDAVFLASNAEDTLRRLDLATGEEEWTFTTNGPIRIAPTIANNRVYIGSDDGFAYCLDAETGKEIWRHSPAPTQERFLNNGRAISFWPVRTGVLVEDGIAYFGSGLFPWRSSYLCALDAETGEKRYERDLGTGLTLEGGLLASQEHLLVPQGRIAPRLFKRSDGSNAGSLVGGGGSFVLLLDDGSALHGPGNKKPTITQSRAGEEEKIAAFDGGSAIVVHDGIAYLATEHSITAISRIHDGVEWTTSMPPTISLILAGDTLYAGGHNEVFALRAKDGKILWREEILGRAYGLAVANESLVVSTDEGKVYGFQEGDTARKAPTIKISHPENIELLATAPSPPPKRTRSKGLLDRWVFHADLIQNVQPDPNDPRFQRTIRNLVKDGRPAPLAGQSKLVELIPSNPRAEEALRLDGSTVDACIAESFHDDELPIEAITVEAWVRVDKPIAWGGILSVAQDNGEYEKGFILGYRDNRFGFAVNGTGGPDVLTWITAPTPFNERGWHHVVGTYDGKRIRLYVDGKGVQESTVQSGPIQYPTDAFYHLGAYRDDDEYFRLNGALNEVRLYNIALSPKEISRNYKSKQRSFPDPPEIQPEEPTTSIARGPIVNVLSPTSAQVRWWTSSPLPSRLDLERNGIIEHEIRNNSRTLAHEVVIDDLQPNALYQLRIHGRKGQKWLRTKPYDLDTHFDFALPPIPEGLSASSPLASRLSTEEAGIAMVFGAGDFARDLAISGAQSVIVVEEDPQQADTFRNQWREEGLYGRRLSLIEAQFGATHLPSRIADLVVFDPNLPQPGHIVVAEASRLVQPGGSLVLSEDVPQAQLPPSLIDPGTIQNGLRFAIGLPIEGAQPWTHMYGLGDNKAYAGETLGGAEQIGDLTLQWAGRPGPRYQSDRGNRKPSPLAADGRLFVQGLNRVIAIDAYNGTILWELGLPELQRFNIPRDCSNWCTDGDELFLATASRASVVECSNGKIVREFVVPDAQRGFAWGFIAREGNLLLGTAVDSRAPFTEWWGGEHWYDSKDGPLAAKVCSDSIFAIDHETGKELWSRTKGLILNPTITVTPETVYFLECHDTQLRAGESRRLDGEVFWSSLQLVALDIETGEERWVRDAKPLPGTSIVSLVAAEGKLILQTSKDGKFGVYVLDSTSGTMVWRSTYDWETDHHGKHLSRPLVVGGTIYLRPLTIDLETGEVKATAFPAGHQCGTYTASRDALFLRAGELAMWDRDSGSASRFDRLRPDCWVSTIPAEGMLLSPEGGGGCSCGSWMETSMGLLPRGSVRMEPAP